MAKKQDELGSGGLFRRTEQDAQQHPADNSDLDEGNIRPSGVGLREGEIRALDAIAGQYDISRNSILRYAARWFILQYRAGQVDLAELVEEKPLKKQPKRRLKMPRR